MILKIVVNLSVAFILFPLLLISKDLENILKGNYQYYDSYYNSLNEYLYVLLHAQVYPFSSFLFLSFILIPFQLIKDYYYKKRKTLIFLKKVVCFFLILIVFTLILGTFSNIWLVPWWHNLIYIFYSFLVALLFTTILYLLIDRWTEIKKLQQNAKEDRVDLD
ncbi:hypothetical protein [Empedobacter falsenii]|uniref:DUF4293 family protein n=1 Tax=Empedobacter falsenii TaxID=343874 RepID=A0AAW7DLW3_9FLAO|nr:hypothetical protein [Empedobacter falsenii]MDM1551655.1 hypothetical protein [Empedobacter falsenii]